MSSKPLIPAIENPTIDNQMDSESLNYPTKNYEAQDSKVQNPKTYNPLGMKLHHRFFRRILPPIFIALACLLAIFDMVIGAYQVDFFRVWEIIAHNLLGTPSRADTTENLIVWTIRFPRMIAAFLIGAGLASSGAVMQGMFRNPLADPGLIGVSAGASVMAAIAIVLAGVWFTAAQKILGFWLIPVFAFVGGVTVTVFIYTISITERGVSVVTMLLAGIAINAIVSSISGTMTYIATDAQLRDIAFWSLGSLGGISWKYIPIALVLLFVCLAITRLARGLNALLLGEAEARHMGIDTTQFNRWCVVLTALAVAICVSIAGPIAFVGIVVPHVIRLLAGPDHRFLLPNSMVLGGCLVLFSDILARTMFPPAEIPIGIITAAIGAPFFLYVLLRNKKHIQ